MEQQPEPLEATEEMDTDDEASHSKEKKIHACVHPGCNKSFSRPSRLETHLLSHSGHKPFVCEFIACEKAYSRRAHLKRHVANFHMGSRCSSSAASNDISCETCGKPFANPDSLKKHVRVAHSDSSGKRYPCPHCSQTFPKRNFLHKHVAQHLEIEPFQCDVCGKGFKLPSRLKKHMKVHEGYKCAKCSEVFTHFSQLRKHNSQQHNSASVTCSVCQKSVAKGQEFREHWLTHSDLREAFHCPYANCSRFYYFERNLRQHINSYHVGQRFECPYEDCSMKLATRGSLKKHLAAKHPQQEEQPKKQKTKKAESKKKCKRLPSKSVLGILTGAVLSREQERELVRGRVAVDLDESQLNQEVNRLQVEQFEEDENVALNGDSHEPPTAESRDAEPFVFIMPVMKSGQSKAQPDVQPQSEAPLSAAADCDGAEAVQASTVGVDLSKYMVPSM